MFSTDILTCIGERYSKLTKSEKKVAEYILKNGRETQFLSISLLAEACGVADGTIFRFCKALGYKGYNELKLALAKSSGKAERLLDEDGDVDIYSSITLEDDITTTSKKLAAMYSAAVEQTCTLLDFSQVKKAATLLHGAQRIYCLGQGGSMILAKEALARFITVSNRFVAIEETHMQVMNSALLGPEDAIWFFSYSGSTRDMLDILGPAHERGAKIILVTRFVRSPAAQFADLVLVCGSNESPMQSGAMVTKVAQLFVIDMVFQEYLRVSPEDTELNLSATAEAIAKRLL